jgi:5-methylcytosine-specific restriction protein B
MLQWEAFYEELADKLMPYRNRQPELIQILRDAQDQGLNVIRLQESEKANGEYITEIDPFTFYASFNRHTTDDKRIATARFIKKRLGLQVDAPTGFGGIPIFNNQKAWFFSWKHLRKPGDIPALWALAEAVVRDDKSDVVGPLFDRCLDIISVAPPKLSIGMFLLRPQRYLPCDQRTRNYLITKGIRRKVENFADYQQFMQQAMTQCGSDLVKISSDAYDYSIDSDREKHVTTHTSDEPGEDNRRHAVRVGTDVPLNLILYGPPGTGKTYQAINRALDICGIEVSEDRKSDMSNLKELQRKGRIEMVTFHQSYSYEEFVEGIRPEISENEELPEEAENRAIRYEYREGIFKQIAALAGTKRERNRQGYSFDDSRVGFWKMSLGNTAKESGTRVYEYCIQHNCILLGYGMSLDFTRCTDRASVKRRLKEEIPEIRDTDYHLVSMNCFRNRIKQGDLVVVSDGLSKFRAIGRIAGEYRYASDTGLDHYVQERPVEWLVIYDESQPREMIFKKSLSQMTLYALDPNDLKMDVLKSILAPEKPQTPENHVLIIDEINRGNISKIFGELITLVEADKRIGGKNEMSLKLPYTQQVFGVPGNLFIIGTMNTADRSIAFMDTALRRRFEFIEMMPDSSVLRNALPDNGVVEGVDVVNLLETLNKRITFLYDRDHQIGHSYFMDIHTLADLRDVFLKRVIPLLREYFYDDDEKVCVILGCAVDTERPDVPQTNAKPILRAERMAEEAILGFDHSDFEDKILCEVNGKFRTAEGDDLVAFFLGILGSTGA